MEAAGTERVHIFLFTPPHQKKGGGGGGVEEAKSVQGQFHRTVALAPNYRELVLEVWAKSRRPGINVCTTVVSIKIDRPLHCIQGEDSAARNKSR